jgi:phage portal protein BeeE
MAQGLRWLTRKTARTRGDHVEDRVLTRTNVPAAMLPSTPGGQTITPQTATRISDAYACIRALADAAASLPLITYRRTPTPICWPGPRRPPHNPG